jgi:diphthamide biosynthesis enzyme Dph1/Dph2-like protein
MKTLFLDAPYSGDVELCSDTLDYVKEKGYTKVGLYASVQFVGQLEKVRKQLAEHNITIITSKADRTNVEGQLLGCDNYHNSLNVELDSFDCYLYVGDGKFHPLALVYGQKDVQNMKEIICNDPIQGKMTLMGVEDVSTILKKYKGSLVKFLSSDVVGLLHTIKPGQEQFKHSLAIEKQYPHKKFYHFIDNVVSFNQLENFNFIEVWINTTCPRVGFDDQEKFEKGVVNITDAMNAAGVLEKFNI